MVLSEEEKIRIIEEEKLRKSIQGKNVVVAVILSFLLPGLGDLYCGSWLKALLFFVLDLFSFLLLFAMGLGSLLYSAVWLCGLISAWLSAGKSERRSLKKAEQKMALKT